MPKPFNCSNCLLCPDGRLVCKFTMQVCHEPCTDKFEPGHANLFKPEPIKIPKIVKKRR